MKAVPGRNTRPTTDRVKESVFGILGELLAGARVLDLFAGTGALGIEALSRGAVQAVFVEREPRAAGVLRENLRRTGLAGEARVLVRDVLAALGGARGAEVGGPFDLVLLDPPYGTGLAGAALERLGSEGASLSDEALVMVEHSNHELPPDGVGTLRLVRRERYGETVVSFYRKTAGAGAGPCGGGEASR